MFSSADKVENALGKKVKKKKINTVIRENRKNNNKNRIYRYI